MTGGNSLLYDDGINIGLGTVTPGYPLHIISGTGTRTTQSENSGPSSTALSGFNTAAMGAGNGNGVLGSSAQSAGFGMFAQNQNTNGTAMYAIGNNLGTASYLVTGSGGALNGSATGLFARSTTSGVSQSVYTDNFSNIVRVNHWNGVTQYKILGNGTMSTVVHDPTDPARQRKVVLHAPETPEIYFEDYGEAHLEQGYAHVELDPILLGNVVIDDKHPLRVFVQLEENEFTRGVVVKNKTTHGFDVVELAGGKSDMPFQWHIICNRADEVLPNGRISHNADIRFEAAELPLQQQVAAPMAASDKPSPTEAQTPVSMATGTDMTWLRAFLPNARSNR